MKRLLTALASFAIVATLFAGTPKPVFASGGADTFYVGFGGGSDAGCGTPDYDLNYGWDGDTAKLEDALYEFLDNDGTLDVTDGDTIVICDGWFNLHAQPIHWNGDLTPGVDVSPSTLTIRGVGKGDTVIDGIDPTDGGDTGPYRPFYFENTNLILEDMTIINTSPNAETGDDDGGSNNGGAVFLENGSLTVNDVDFINSVSDDGSGQAIAAVDADVEITNSTFDSTTGWDWFDSLLNEGDGGAVYVSSNSSSNPNPTVTIDNSTFQNLGTQGNGGAVALYCADAEISDSYFYDNTSGYQGGAIFASGQEGDCDSTGSLTIDNTVFEGNYTHPHFGGEGESSAGGGAISVIRQPLTITNSNFGNGVGFGGGNGNWSSDGSGGAIYLDGTSGTLLSISDTEFIDNSSGWNNGGAIATRCANVEITGDATGTAADGEEGWSTFFAYNQAYNNGGAVMTSGSNCNDDEGDDSFDEWVTTSITGAVFASNFAGEQGGAVSNEQSGGFSWLRSFNINKSSFWGNETTDNGMGGALNSDRSDAVVSNSYFAWNESDNQGGAMEFCSADLTLTNTGFYENHVWDNSEAGGAVFFADGCGANATLKVDGSSFDSNGAGRNDNGGAIARYDDGFGDDFIKNSTFTDNTTGASGGAVYTEADLVVTGSTFDDNHAQRTYFGHGGAIAAWGGNESLTVSGSIFRDNTSGWNGGAIAVRDDSYLTISSSLFDGNISRDEGGAVMGYSDIEGMEILNSTFTNNLTLSDEGGAIFFTGQNGADFTVSNSRFTDNSSGYEGGAIYARLRGNSSTGTSLMAVTKSTFTGNMADADGGAINHDVSGSDDYALLTITDSTFTRNEANSDGGAVDSTGTVIVTGNRFVGNTTYYDSAGALQLNYEGGSAFSVITKNTFENNAAARPFENNLDTISGDGGAIEFEERVVITNNSFVRNTATGKNERSDGGAIEGGGYGTTVMNNSFLNNAASGNGGALSFYNFSYDGLRSKITGNTFDSNAAGNGGGAMWIEDNEGTNDFKAQISDNRILRNTAMNGAGLYMAWESTTPRFVAPTGILRNVFERNIASVNGGGIMIEYFGGAYRDSRAAQQSLLKAVKNNRYVGNKANRDRSTATVGGLNVPTIIEIGSLSAKDVEPVAE